MITRRGFLRGALASVPVLAIGGELAELLEPKRRIFLPPRGGWPVQATGGNGPYTYTWFWKQGGGGIVIDSPSAPETSFTPVWQLWPARATHCDGVAQCVVQDSAGRQQVIEVPVTVARGDRLVRMA